MHSHSVLAHTLNCLFYRYLVCSNHVTGLVRRLHICLGEVRFFLLLTVGSVLTTPMLVQLVRLNLFGTKTTRNAQLIGTYFQVRLQLLLSDGFIAIVTLSFVAVGRYNT